MSSPRVVPIQVAEALAADPGERFDVVLANPPFGKKSGTQIEGADGRRSTEEEVIERDDFWATTSNKQLNLVQHIKTLLKSHGRAAVVQGRRTGEPVDRPANRHDRAATWSEEVDCASGSGPDGRWRAYAYDELIARDKASLDIFWLKDDSLADSDNLPPPEVIAQEIVEDLEAALEQFRLIAGDLNGSATEST